MICAYRFLFALIFFLTALCPRPGSAAEINLGEALGRPGDRVSVPVMCSATEEVTAALLRLEYDGSILEATSVGRGPLLSRDHALDFEAPAVGRANVVVYGVSGVPVLATQSGELLSMDLIVSATAVPGFYSIGLTPVGEPKLPNANLVDTGGNLVPHSISGGTIIIHAMDEWRSPTMLLR